MKPSALAAALLLTLMLILSQCVVIGGMAWESSQTHGELDRAEALLETAKAQIPNEFYRGMYKLCIEAFAGSGYPEAEIVAGCNEHVSEERDLQTHLRTAEGYKP